MVIVDYGAIVKVVWWKKFQLSVYKVFLIYLKTVGKSCFVILKLNKFFESNYVQCLLLKFIGKVFPVCYVYSTVKITAYLDFQVNDYWILHATCCILLYF